MNSLCLIDLARSSHECQALSLVRNVGTRYRMLSLQLRVRALAQHCRNLGKGALSKSTQLFQSPKFHCVTVCGELHY
jgi:hypothetical protein